MKKFNNKGFTLLELIVAMSILTVIILVGYKIFNKYSILMHTQVKINKGQLNMNTINEYLTKDLEQSESVFLSIDQDSEQQKEDLSKIDQEFSKLINDAKNNSFKYVYTINSKDKSKNSYYEVFLIYKNNEYRYSIKRIDSNSTISLINEEIIKDKSKPPFTIKGNNPYEVSMQYNGKYGKVVSHKFEVASRYVVAIGGDNTEESTPPNEDNIQKPPEDDDIVGDISGAHDYLNYCLGKAKDYIKELINKEASNLIKEIYIILGDEIINYNDLLMAREHVDQLINIIKNIRNNSSKEYLDKNQANLNGAENYLNVVKNIIDNYNNQNNYINRDYLEKIISAVSSDLKGQCLSSGSNSAKNLIRNLKDFISDQKNKGNNNSTPIGQEVDKQAAVIDKYESALDNDIVSKRVDKMPTMLWSIVGKIDQNTYIGDDIDEFSQFINDTIDIIIEFDISLKTYIYNNIPVSDNIPESLIKDINLAADKVSLQLKEANKILIGIKAQLNKVNYMKINN